MSGPRESAVSTARWTYVGATFGFALLWLVLANQYRPVGALLMLGAGLLLSVFFVRKSARQSATTPTEPAAPPSTGPRPTIPVHETIDEYSADPEDPEHRRARFLGALGHELRNPLNSVTGFSDMLLGGVDGELNAEQERSVRTIRASAERLLRLVSTLVDHAKLEAGTMRLQQQWVAPGELITEAIGFARSRAEGTSIIGGVSEGLPRVFVDRHRTVQALVSLTVLVIRSSETDIAIRVAPPRRDQSGKGFVQFDLMASLKDSSADTLTVVEKLEKPLSRSDALGLEVAVARSVIETQGGRIWTEAGTAGSLRVCMTLPTSAS
jgi:signal transduction histidine kinase